jgi:glycosyltransferase involved in cell wall biosynthesis
MNTNGINVKLFHFGRKKEDESINEKIIGRIIDLLKYIGHCLKFKPDIIHLNSAFDKQALLRDVGYCLISFFMHKKLFIKYHGSKTQLLMNRHSLWRLLINICKLTAHAGVLSTEEMRNFIYAGFAKNKIYVVKNSINVKIFKNSRRNQNNHIRLFFISRFIPTKGLLYVIQAVRIIMKQRKDVLLTCVGDGVEMKAAKKLVEKHKLQNNVIFTGYLKEEEAIECYKNSDIFILPTLEEGFSMAVFQAVAAGLMILTTPIRAAADYLHEPENCLWIKPKDAKLIAEKIIYLINNPERKNIMRKNNQLLAMQFDGKNIADEYIKIYKDILN